MGTVLPALTVVVSMRGLARIIVSVAVLVSSLSQLGLAQPQLSDPSLARILQEQRFNSECMNHRWTRLGSKKLKIKAFSVLRKKLFSSLHLHLRFCPSINSYGEVKPDIDPM